ncbi:MAG: pentapeptide repeat-containing protein [Cyanosarcina radialis HA8281-LM2]|jgi:uncharacterized protein YjbI with pentapeptide repeats|nr:pentapeptide repeat-containing protein [Cyanosarcina radialis HA8281-LM2]
MNYRLHHLWSAVRNLVIVLVASLVTLGAIAHPVLALDYNQENLTGADFSGRVLTDSSFTKTNLKKSNLSHTDLRGVSLFGANFQEANLEGANLTNATLDTAKFAKANLTNAILEGAFAFNAKFDKAIVDGADFTDVLLREDVREQLCQLAKGTNPTTGRNTRDTLMCE